MKYKSVTAGSLVIILVSAGAILLSSDGIRYIHKPHLDKATECERCHKSIKKSNDTASGRDIPPRAICNECHKEADGYSRMLKYTYRQAYKFNHKVHVVGQGLVCRDCHGALFEKNEVVQEEIVPKMEYCFQCHDNTTATQYCMLCHVNSTRPDDHTAEWSKLHGKKATADKKGCLSCHATKESCLRCHRGTKGLYRYHSPNFELSHKYESRISLKHCRACHGERQCRDCHKNSGVDYKNPALQRRHPIGWTNRLSSNFHGKKGRINIVTCTTCHTKNECNYCHFWIKRD
jgi:hypothetical protein